MKTLQDVIIEREQENRKAYHALLLKDRMTDGDLEDIATMADAMGLRPIDVQRDIDAANDYKRLRAATKDKAKVDKEIEKLGKAFGIIREKFKEQEKAFHLALAPLSAKQYAWNTLNNNLQALIRKYPWLKTHKD